MTRPSRCRLTWLLLTPTPRQKVVYLSQSSCVSSAELTDKKGGGEGGEPNHQIIQRRESLVFYTSFNTLCCAPFAKIRIRIFIWRGDDVHEERGSFLLDGKVWKIDLLLPCKATWKLRRKVCGKRVHTFARIFVESRLLFNDFSEVG
jgi:hypothetical protein